MADIQTILDQILKARYGKDVRQNIHDGIQQCYLDAKDNAIGNNESLISAGNYLEKLPDVDEAEGNTIFRLNFSSNSETIPDNLPYSKWKKGMAVLLTLSGQETSGGVYRIQLFFDIYDVWIRYKGVSWSEWHPLGTEDKLLCFGNLDNKSSIPDMDDAPENKILVFNFSSGSKEIPEHTPYGDSGWNSSTMAIAFSLKGYHGPSDDRIPASYRTQFWIDTNTMWFRYYGLNWSDWKNIGSSKESIVVRVEEGESLLEKAILARNIKASKLIVAPGTYDLIQEYKDYYGASYFDNYVDYNQGDKFDRGLWFTNIDVEFNPGAKVLANYDGSNKAVTNYFSAIAMGTNVTLKNLVLEAANLRYGIHPDFSYDRDDIALNDTGYIRFINCDLKHKAGDNEQTIGAGFGRHEIWEIENCIFRSENNKRVFRIHQNSGEPVQSKLVMKDCYFDGPGFATFNYYGPSTDVTEVLVSNCSYVNPPVVQAEYPSYSNENVKMLLWNNEQRQ